MSRYHDDDREAGSASSETVPVVVSSVIGALVIGATLVLALHTTGAKAKDDRVAEESRAAPEGNLNWPDNPNGEQPKPHVNPPREWPPRDQPPRERIPREQPPAPPADPRVALLDAVNKLPAGVLAPPLVEYEGLRLTRFRLKADDLVPNVVWSRDGKGFYCLEKATGTLYRVSLDGFKVLKSKVFDVKASWLSECADGLLLSAANPWQFFLVNPETLEAVKNDKVPENFRAVSSPKLSSVYIGPTKDSPLGGGGGFALWNPASGKYVAQFLPQAFPRGAGFLNPVVSPDGKYLFAVAGGSLVRYRIDGPRLVFEQTSPDVVVGYNAPREPLVTADSQYVHLHVGGGNVNSSGGVVFRLGNLSAPAFTFRHAAHAGASAVDVAGGKIYSHDYDKFVVHDGQGNRLKDYKLHPQGEGAWRYFVHPSGDKLLALTDRGVSYIELQK